MTKMILPFICFILSFTVQAQVNPESVQGLWKIQGVQSEKGSYSGTLEIRPSTTVNNSLDVIRLITYDTYLYKGLRVQEIWTGQILLSEKTFTASYQLKQAGYVTQLENKVVPIEKFNASLPVVSTYSPVTLLQDTQVWQSEFSIAMDERALTFKEKLSEHVAVVNASPLWNSQRYKESALGKAVMPYSVRVVMNYVKIKIDFESDPKVIQSQDKPEFKDEQPQKIIDPTDYSFYQKEKNILRVANRTLDDVALFEAEMRYRAYSKTLEQKAVELEKTMRTQNINQYGMVTYANLDSNGNFLHEVVDGDSALWTGMYVATESIRYLVTKDEQALANIKKSMEGIITLLEIPKDPKEFARTLMPYSPTVPLNNEWHRGEGEYSHLIWKSGGNNDMVKGIYHAFMWAYLALPENDSLRPRLKSLVERLPKLKVNKKKAQNEPVAIGLASLWTGNQDLREEYIKIYDGSKIGLSGYDFNTIFNWKGIADWSGVNLAVVSFVTQILLAGELQAEPIQSQLRERLMDAWGKFSAVRHSLISIAAYQFAFQYGTRGNSFKDKFTDAEFMKILEDSIWTLREYPVPRPSVVVAYDHSLGSEFVVSPFLRMFWKGTAFQDPEPREYFLASLYMYPVFESSGISSNFIWKDHFFNFKGTANPYNSNPSVDFLYSYWMSQYAQLKWK